MSASVDNAVQVLRQANDELQAAKNESSDLQNLVNASNTRVLNATDAFNSARAALADAALEAE
jgi:hypothetical protein